MVNPPMPESNMPMGASLVMGLCYMPSLVFTKSVTSSPPLYTVTPVLMSKMYVKPCSFANLLDGVPHALNHGRKQLLLHLGQIVLDGGAKFLQARVQLLQFALLLLADGVGPRACLRLVVREFGLQLRTHACHFGFVFRSSRFNRSLGICALGQGQQDALGVEVAKTLGGRVGQGERRGQNEEE